MKKIYPHRKINILLTLLFSILILILSNIEMFAQRNNYYTLDSVVVSAGRLPFSFSNLTRTVTVLTSKDIKHLPVDNITDVLEYIAGVDLQQRGIEGVQADVSIRGGTFNQTLILINGIKVSDPQTGHFNLNLPISIDDVQRIEVLKGQGSKIYGPDALSGVINIITKKNLGNYVKLKIIGGENSFYNAEIQSGNKIGKIQNNITISKRKSNGYIHNTGFDISNLILTSYYPFKNGIVNLLAAYNDKKFGANGFYSAYFPNQWEHTSTTFLNLSGEYGTTNFQISPKIYWRKNNDEFLLNYLNPAFYENNHRTDIIGSEIQTSFKTEFGSTSIGGEYIFDRIKSNNLGYHHRQKKGIFAEQRKSFNKLTISLGMFVYKYAYLPWKIWPGIDASYKLPDNIRVYASVGKAFRIPTYTELYYHDPITLGNKYLKPEESLNYEIGLNQKTFFFSANFSLFDRIGKNLIDWIKKTNDNKWRAVNFAKVNTFGFGLNVSITPQKIISYIPIKRINIGYTYLNSDKIASGFKSRYIFNYLKHQLQITIFHSLLWEINAGWFFRFEDRVNLGKSIVVNTKIYRQFRRIELFININNIFNKTYMDFSGLPLPGRWVYAGIKMNINKL